MFVSRNTSVWHVQEAGYARHNRLEVVQPDDPLRNGLRTAALRRATSRSSRAAPARPPARLPSGTVLRHAARMALVAYRHRRGAFVLGLEQLRCGDQLAEGGVAVIAQACTQKP